jgi:hypothetical protein
MPVLGFVKKLHQAEAVKVECLHSPYCGAAELDATGGKSRSYDLHEQSDPADGKMADPHPP